MVDLSSVALKYTWIFTKRLVLFPDPNNPAQIASGISREILEAIALGLFGSGNETTKWPQQRSTHPAL